MTVPKSVQPYYLSGRSVDGQYVHQLLCPQCGEWGDIDDEQFFGLVSIQHECGFHENINLERSKSVEWVTPSHVNALKFVWPGGRP